jgi:hypothetical protein
VKELKTASLITKTDNKKGQRSINPYLLWKNAWEPLMLKKARLVRASMYHSGRANLLWFCEIHSCRVRRQRLWCWHAFVQGVALLIILWIHSDMLKGWKKSPRITLIFKLINMFNNRFRGHNSSSRTNNKFCKHYHHKIQSMTKSRCSNRNLLILRMRIITRSLIP